MPLENVVDIRDDAKCISAQDYDVEMNRQSVQSTAQGQMVQRSNQNVSELMANEHSHPREDHDSDSDTDSNSDSDAVDGNNNNAFAVKKTLVQGMMDVALITANANQMRYIIEFSSSSWTYYFVFTLIVISILLQLAVGISLIWAKRSYHDHVHDEVHQHRFTDLCNKIVLIAVFFITIINIFIATFPIAGPSGQMI